MTRSRMNLLLCVAIVVLTSQLVSAAQTMPDAIVSSITAIPANPVIGDTVRLFATIRNIGSASTPLGVPVGTGAQVDGAHVGSFFVRNGSGQTVPLGAGQSYSAEFDGTWTAVQGNHTFCVFVDDINRFAESNESNNSGCQTIVVAQPPQPDVVITAVTLSPASPTAGDTVSVRATIANIGDAATPAGVAVGTGIQVDGAHLGSFFVRDPSGQAIPLGAGQSFLGTADVTWIATEGNHLTCAYADDINRFRESNEYNNSACTTVSVTPVPQPDVIITSVTLDPPNPSAGDIVTVHATIRNIGNASTPAGVAVGTGIQVDGSYLGSFFVRSASGQAVPLGEGQSFLGTADATWTATEGDHLICAYADDVDRFSESDENNNYKCAKLDVPPAPLADLTITAIRLDPAEPVHGDEVRVWATVANIGTLPTPDGIQIVNDVFVGSSFLGTFRVKDASGQTMGLAPNGQYTGSPDASWSASAGKYRVCVTADSADLIAEPEIDNNELCIQIVIDEPDPCSRSFTPEDFGEINGTLLAPELTAANQFISYSGCAEVTLTLTPGSYVYSPDPPHGGIDLRGDLGASTVPDVTVRFQAGQYYFNHELYFSGFSSDKNLVVEGAGKERSLLTFCQNPPDCDCVEIGPGTTCRLPYTGYSMLHFRTNPTKVVVRDLSLQSKKHRVIDQSGNPAWDWEFDTGVSFCFDGSACEDLMVSSVNITAAEHGILFKNASGLTVMNSFFRNVGYGISPSYGNNRSVLLYNNEVRNDNITGGSRYGVFTDGSLSDSAFVANRFFNIGERGIYPSTGTDGLWIHDNRIENAGIGTGGAGINLGKYGLNDVLVSGNDIMSIGSVVVGNLGSLPITTADEDTFDMNACPVRSSTVWPNNHWNAYGIALSGATSGAIGIVQNSISGAGSHGIMLVVGASRVMVYKNTVSSCGVNGLSIVPGYAYEGEFGYLQTGGVASVWVQDNTFEDSRRGGIEILPRGTPLFAVPAICEEPSTCLHAHRTFRVCPATEGCELCVDLYDPTSCGEHCYQASWQSYQVDMHANTTKGNDMANVIIDGIREDGDDIDVHYTISGIGPEQIDQGWAHNFHIYPDEHTGQSELAATCVSHDEGLPLSRADNAAVASYRTLIQRVQDLDFRYFDGGGWSTVNLWTSPLFVYEVIDFSIDAPSTCGNGSSNRDKAGGIDLTGGWLPGHS